MTDAILRKRIFLKADKPTVWAYLTDPDKLATWFHKPKAPLAKGPYALFGTESGDKLIWGDVSVFDPCDVLEYSFTVQPMGDATSTVRWQLDTVAGGTMLSLEHSGLPQSQDAFGLILGMDKGWDEHLARMREHAHAD